MNDQIERYYARRSAMTLPDGSRPCAWWRKYQQHVGGTKTVSEIEIRREAARIAKAQTERAGGKEL